jgi:hypothetical protein
MSYRRVLAGCLFGVLLSVLHCCGASGSSGRNPASAKAAIAAFSRQCPVSARGGFPRQLGQQYQYECSPGGTLYVPHSNVDAQKLVRSDERADDPRAWCFVIASNWIATFPNDTSHSQMDYHGAERFHSVAGGKLNGTCGSKKGFT